MPQSPSSISSISPDDQTLLDICSIVSDLQQLPRQKASQEQLKVFYENSSTPEVYKKSSSQLKTVMNHALHESNTTMASYADAMQHLHDKPWQLTSLLVEKPALKNALHDNMGALKELNKLWVETQKTASSKIHGHNIRTNSTVSPSTNTEMTR